MGGEREMTVDAAEKPKTKKGDELPGTSSGFLVEHFAQANQKLRIHESAGYIHFHDDVAVPKIKVAIPVSDAWKAWDRLSTPKIGEPNEWKAVDSVNNSVVECEVVCVEDAAGWNIEARLRVKRAKVNDAYANLANFFKRKPR
jgi:hypothetical protein